MKPTKPIFQRRETLTMKFDGGRQSDEKPVTRTETLQHANPDLYPTVVTITTILLTMPVATATPSSTFVSYPLHTAQVNNTIYARSLVSSGEISKYFSPSCGVD